jgi:hypothetical protein
LVDTWVEGCISLIRFIQAGNREFVESVDTYSQTITEEEKELGAKKRKSI